MKLRENEEIKKVISDRIMDTCIDFCPDATMHPIIYGAVLNYFANYEVLVDKDECNRILYYTLENNGELFKRFHAVYTRYTQAKEDLFD